MQKVDITTTLTREFWNQLACQTATESGFNCYSKAVKLPDEDIDGGRVFYFKWKGKTLAVTIRPKEVTND